MARILIIGENPRLDTGQGRIGRTVANALSKAGYGILYLAWCPTETNRNRQLPYKIIFDAQGYGKEIFNRVVTEQRPDIVLSIGDPWNVEYIGRANTRGLFQWIAYTAVDGLGYSGGIPLHFEEYLYSADRIVTYTEYGRRGVLKTMPDKENYIDRIYHGIDEKVFYPVKDEEIKTVRQQLGISDKFVCLYVGRTHHRKNITYIFKALRLLQDTNQIRNTMLWMHSNFTDPAGYNIGRLASEHGVSGRILSFDAMAKSNSAIEMIKEKELNYLYNACDCLINIGGEGFGFAIGEAMCTKLPVITLDHSASGELGGDGRAILIKPSDFITGLEMTERPLINPGELAVAIIKCRDFSNVDMVNNAYNWAKANIAQSVIDKKWKKYMDKFEHPLDYKLVMETVG